MPDQRPTISTHILDTELGMPAAGVHVRLLRLLADGAEVEAGTGTTDADGRIRDLLDDDLLAGDYRLVFDLTGRPAFFVGLRVDVRVEDVARSYHVPVLLAPFAVTTYRGS